MFFSIRPQTAHLDFLASRSVPASVTHAVGFSETDLKPYTVHASLPSAPRSLGSYAITLTESDAQKCHEPQTSGRPGPCALAHLKHAYSHMRLWFREITTKFVFAAGKKKH